MVLKIKSFINYFTLTMLISFLRFSVFTIIPHSLISAPTFAPHGVMCLVQDSYLEEGGYMHQRSGGTLMTK